MIKTFEQFAQSVKDEKKKKEMYTPEEFKEVYDIVSEYYDGDGDIEAFICADDENGDKSDFVDEHDLYGELDVCRNCGKFVVNDECIIIDNSESYCSFDCAIKAYGHSRYEIFYEKGLVKVGWNGEPANKDDEDVDYRTDDEIRGTWSGGYYGSMRSIPTR